MSGVRSMAREALRRVSALPRSFGAPVDRKIRIPAIEFFLTDLCNLRCDNCAASAPYLSSANHPDLNSFVESLAYLAPVASCDELRLLGGEPLLNKEICAFLLAARDSRLFRRLKVITNGLLLPKMSEEFWQLADIVRISLYPAAAKL